MNATAQNLDCIPAIVWRCMSGSAAFWNSIVIHNYRWRLGLADGESKLDVLERRLTAAPAMIAPTITMEGDANGAPHPDAAVCAKKFIGRYRHRVADGRIGHNLPREAPQAFAKAVLDVAAEAR
jgi:hypothetical protein